MSTTADNQVKRLEQVLASYGSDPQKWPEAERNMLLAALDTHPHFRAFVQMEAVVDDYLSHDLEELHAPSTLSARLQQEAERLHGPSSFWRDLFGTEILRPTAGLLTAALLGILIGWYSPTIMPDDEVRFDDLAISKTILDWGQENENG